MGDDKGKRESPELFSKKGDLGLACGHFLTGAQDWLEVLLDAEIAKFQKAVPAICSMGKVLSHFRYSAGDPMKEVIADFHSYAETDTEARVALLAMQPEFNQVLWGLLPLGAEFWATLAGEEEGLQRVWCFLLNSFERLMSNLMKNCVCSSGLAHFF